jgi:hypothetical protein
MTSPVASCWSTATIFSLGRSPCTFTCTTWSPGTEGSGAPDSCSAAATDTIRHILSVASSGISRSLASSVLFTWENRVLSSALLPASDRLCTVGDSG